MGWDKVAVCVLKMDVYATVGNWPHVSIIKPDCGARREKRIEVFIDDGH
jgi:hypothetical protein